MALGECIARNACEVFALTAPAYLWLAATVLSAAWPPWSISASSPLSPMGGQIASFTLAHYISFFTKPIYWYNAWRSIELGIYVTAICASRRLSGRARLAKSRQGPLARSDLPADHPALLVQRAGAGPSPGPWCCASPSTSCSPIRRSSIGLVHAYLPYAILTCYISLQAIDEFADRGRRAASVPRRPRPSAASFCRSACRAFSPPSS